MLVVASFLVGSCAAGRQVGKGQKYEEAGNHFAAGNRYLAALDTDGEHQEARAGLNRVVEEAYVEERGRAVAFEEAGDNAEALKSWEKLQRFVQRAKGHGAQMAFPMVDLNERIQQNRHLASQGAYQMALALAKERRWDEAIQHFARAEKISEERPYQDSQAQMIAAYQAWSDDLEKAGRYRLSAEKRLGAHKLDDKNPSHASRAAAIHLALGRHFTSRGFCRQALVDLEKARGLLPRAVGPDDLEAAESCARTPLRIPAFAFSSQARRARSTEVGDQLARRVQAALRTSAGEAVQIVEGRGAQAGGRAAKGHRVLGRIELLESTRTRENRSQERGTIEPNKGSLTYDLVQREARFRLKGAVRVVRVSDGEQVFSLDFDVEEKDAIRYAENVRVNGRNATGSLEVKKLTIEGVENPARLMDARRQLRDEAELAAQVVDAIAAQVGRGIGDFFLNQPAPEDPGQLEIPQL
jgi:tetratricopeptide (TPR) repeat protein